MLRCTGSEEHGGAFKLAFEVKAGVPSTGGKADGMGSVRAAGVERWLVWGPGRPPAWPCGAGVKSRVSAGGSAGMPTWDHRHFTHSLKSLLLSVKGG